MTFNNSFHIKSRIKSILFLLILQILIFPFFTYAKPLTPSETQFIKKLTPAIQRANQHILKARQRLVILYQQFQKYQKYSTLNNHDQHWLNQLAQYYDVKPEFSKKTTWQSLLTRVDRVPTSLVLAQAIIESGWGRSRFAKEGNNYFGQWCYDKGCGIVPEKRPKGKTYEVKRFSSIDSSITHYLKNLNTNRSYKVLRQLRQRLRSQNKPLNGIALSHGLAHYSQRGSAYVKSLQAIIREYNLQQYDQSLMIEHSEKNAPKFN